MAENFNDVVEYVANELDVRPERVAQVLMDRGLAEEEEIDVLVAMESVRYAKEAGELLFTDED